jgi:hypothetical protein
MTVDDGEMDREPACERAKADGVVTHRSRPDGAANPSPDGISPHPERAGKLREALTLWLHDTRTERAARSAVLMLVIYASAYYRDVRPHRLTPLSARHDTPPCFGALHDTTVRSWISRVDYVVFPCSTKSGGWW